jgi:hypothetical protein
LVDPSRPRFFNDLPFTLNKEQVGYIKNNQVTSALCSGVHLDVIKAFMNNPHNLALL